MGLIRLNIVRKTDDTADAAIRLSKEARDEILWESRGHGYTVRFEVSPFKKGTEFHVAENGAALSGPLDPEAEVGAYEYDVIPDGPKGGVAADPTVFVDP